jgi:hypothetical protein
MMRQRQWRAVAAVAGLMVGALGAILTKNEKEEEEKGGKRQFPQLSITTKQR